VVKFIVKCPPGRPRSRRENKIRIDVRKMGRWVGRWLELSQNRIQFPSWYQRLWLFWFSSHSDNL